MNMPKETLRILQINLNKSEKAHLELLNNLKGDKWDIVLVQEPHTTSFSAIRTPTRFRPVFPGDRGANRSAVRLIIWVSSTLMTRDWKILNIPNTNDITAIQLSSAQGLLTIFNIYNDCTNNNTETALSAYLGAQIDDILPNDQARMIWAGDFNRHHPLWDRDKDVRLFTPRATRAAEKLLDLVAEHSMAMLLPKGIPTLQHMASGRFSRPDNIFGSPALKGSIEKCEVVPQMRPLCMDHFPIETVIRLAQTRTATGATRNFRNVDWEQFRKELTTSLGQIPKPAPIASEAQLEQAAANLTAAIQSIIAVCVKRTKPRPDAKRWWNSDLKEMRKRINRLRSISYRYRALTTHTVHQELRALSNHYGDEIIQAK